MGVEESIPILPWDPPPFRFGVTSKQMKFQSLDFLLQPLLSQESFSRAPSESNSCFMTFSLKKKNLVLIEEIVLW